MGKVSNINHLPEEISPRKRKVHLKTARQCRAFLAKITNELYCGDVAESKAGRLAYIVNILLRAVEVETVEKKLIELESRVNEAFNKNSKPY